MTSRYPLQITVRKVGSSIWYGDELLADRMDDIELAFRSRGVTNAVVVVLERGQRVGRVRFGDGR